MCVIIVVHTVIILAELWNLHLQVVIYCFEGADLSDFDQKLRSKAAICEV